MSSSETTVSSLSSQDDILLEKAFYAGCCKNFVGTGSRKISKAKIKQLNISKLMGKVSRVKNSSCPLLSTYYLGICRIYEKAVTYLLDDLQKFNDELNSALIGVHKPPSKSKMSKIRLEQEEFLENPNQSLELCEEGDFIPLFERNIETDQHLLHEMDIPNDPVDTLGDFGDEIHLTQHMGDIRKGPSEWSAPSDEVAQLGRSIIDSHQITGGGEIHTSTPAVLPSTIQQAPSTEISSPRSTTQREIRDRSADDRSVASTPKRKTWQGHDETPTKRQRKSPSLVNGHSKEKIPAARRLFDPDGQSSSAPPNTGKRISEDRRLFEHGGQSGSTSTHEMILDGANGYGAEPFDEHIPIGEFNEEARRSSSRQIPSVQDLEQDREPLPTTTDESAQLQPGQLFEDIDDLELGELNDESIAALIKKRPKRLKKWMDEEKQIPKPLNINQRESYTRVHTRPRGSTSVNLRQKESVVDLLSLPAIRLKPRGPCPFGKPLLNLYFEMACPILRANDEQTLARSSLPSLPRDANVNKRPRPRFSIFRRNSRQRSSVPSTPGDQNITLEGDIGNNEDRDRELMPPPRASIRLPEMHSEFLGPSLPTLDQQQQSPQRQLPVTPTRPDTPGVSPRQAGSVSNNFEPTPADTPDDNLVNPHLPFGANPMGDDDSDPRLHHVIERSSSSISLTSEKERSLLMKEEAFYQFLKVKWTEMLDKVDLHSVFPRRPTPVAFFRYFVFLQRLQKAGKLTMLQEIIYGPVHIVKEKEE